MKRLVSTLGFALLLGAVSLPARAGSVTYDVFVDTSSANGEYGYIDLQLDQGTFGTALPVTATIDGFAGDATLNSSDANNDEIGATGTLPGTVTIVGALATDYFEGLTFGNSIAFAVTLAGDGVSLGGGLSADSGSTFSLSFYESDAATPLFASGPAAEIDVDATGTVSAESLADNVTLQPTPEPATLWLTAGIGGLAFAFATAHRRRRSGCRTRRSTLRFRGRWLDRTPRSASLTTMCRPIA
ncbi:MAG: NF038129 family PEP-CTERM protein [Bryobacteraceae bacterium]|jgi:hypothetical protein